MISKYSALLSVVFICIYIYIWYLSTRYHNQRIADHYLYQIVLHVVTSSHGDMWKATIGTWDPTFKPCHCNLFEDRVLVDVIYVFKFIAVTWLWWEGFKILPSTMFTRRLAISSRCSWRVTLSLVWQLLRQDWIVTRRHFPSCSISGSWHFVTPAVTSLGAQP